MSDEEKTQHCLRLLMLRLFDLELQFFQMKAALLSPDQRQGLEDAHKDTMDEFGEKALLQFFRKLRRQAGEAVDETSSDLSSASSDDVWSAFRHADRQESDAMFLDREWKRFWDAL